MVTPGVARQTCFSRPAISYCIVHRELPRTYMKRPTSARTFAPLVAGLVLLQAAGLISRPLGASSSGPLLPCGSSGDFVKDQAEITTVFGFVKGVCGQRGESCPTGAPLPTSCASAECQRAVQLAVDSCAVAFASGFFKSAWAPVLNAAAAVCAAAAAYKAADEQVRREPESVTLLKKSRFCVCH